MNAWSQLPNAVHIDRVIESMKDRPEVWGAAWTNTARNMTWAAAQWAARDAALDAASTAGRNTARHAATNAACRGAGDEARDAARYAAWFVVAALVAWDDSSQFLELDGDALEIYARLSDDPRAVLLLPAVRAFERIKELETV